MLEIFAQRLKERCRVEPGAAVLVAVSGGADSLALLHLLKALAKSWPLTLTVAHLDHGLRDDSHDDAERVAALCARLGVGCLTGRVEVAEFARRGGDGLEAAARRVRYSFLNRQADACGAELIALGHQRGDQAETVLMNLLRGSGPSGLSGMAWRRGRLIRPLLATSRSEIEAYLETAGQDWLVDSSNTDPVFTRNRVRHQLLPQLESFNPRIEQTLSRLAERMTLEEDYWRGQIDALARPLVRRTGQTLKVAVKDLARLHPAVRSRFYRYLLAEVRGDLREISTVHLEALDGLVFSGRPQASVDLPGGWVARRYDDLVVRREPWPVAGSFRCLIEGPGEYPLPDGGLLRVSLPARPGGEGPRQVEFPADRVRFPLELRSVRPGDRFRPSGMAGRKKLKEFFIDAKLSREERDAALVIVGGGEILWLVGYRRCAGYPVGQTPRAIVRMALEPA